MSVYWITGASSGIGEALARNLNGAGNKVIISARNQSKLELVRSQMKFPEAVKIVAFDISDSKNTQTVSDEAFKAFGQIDCVILNAGLSQRSLVEDTATDVYRQLMEVNYFGNVAMVKAILPEFLKKNSGQFVVISSLVGKFGTPFRSGYSASKHALHGFFDSLRAEMMMGQKNIDVSIICPGFVATEISFNALEGKGKATGQHDKANAEGLSADDFAKRAIKAIELKEYESYIGGKEVLGVKLKAYFPNFFARKISRAAVR
jgi:short-subunit dehydrogenase